ncbi:MAG: alpha/beta fold hydrolase [Rhodothermales bacterium]|nr:alpha/beta fold hydrolase [Rhodothermales bacterium]
MRRLAPLLTLALLATGCASVQESLYEAGLRAERRHAGLRPGAVETDLGRIAYLRREAPGPTLVLLHGFGASKDHWVRMAQHLPDSLALLALDLPGHGASAFDPAATYDVPRLVAGVEAALEPLGVGAYARAGNSLGGLVATRLALRQPDRVRALVLLDPAGVVPPEPSPFRERLATGANPLIPTTRAEYDTLLALAFNDPPDLPWPAERVIAREAIGRAPRHRRIWQDVNSPPDVVTADLPALAPPTLLVFGADDRIIDPSSARVWAAHVPDLTAVTVPDTGHAPMLERPAYTARLVADFLRRRAR